MGGRSPDGLVLRTGEDQVACADVHKSRQSPRGMVARVAVSAVQDAQDDLLGASYIYAEGMRHTGLHDRASRFDLTVRQDLELN